MAPLVTTEMFGVPFPGHFKVLDHKPWVKDANQEPARLSLYQASFADYLEFCEEYGRSFEKGPRGNGDKAKEHLFDSRDEWKGGGFDKMIAPITDFGHYERALKEISDNKLWREIAFTFSEASTRRRAKSAHDGEFDYDRRWDIEPFQCRTQRPQTVRIVKIYPELSFSWSVSAEIINQFAGFIAAIISILERNGVMVELGARWTTVGFTNGAASDTLRIELMVKRPDEYLPPGQILKVASSVFYRRGIFALMAASAENLKETVNGGLGRPWSWDGKTWDRVGNEVRIYGVPDIEAQHRIIESLAEMFGVESKTKKEKGGK